MKEKVETNEKVTLINGVLLTDKAIARLIEFQDRDNESIEEIRTCIADAIAFIHINVNQKELTEELRFVITDLFFIRDYFLDFKKP